MAKLHSWQARGGLPLDGLSDVGSFCAFSVQIHVPEQQLQAQTPANSTIQAEEYFSPGTCAQRMLQSLKQRCPQSPYLGHHTAAQRQEPRADRR